MAPVTDQPTNDSDLTGKILIALPGMGDPRFERSVVFLCAHSDEGAMGLIVNKQIDDVSFGDLLEQLEIVEKGGAPDRPVCYGGPVETRRGFVLHSTEYQPGGDEGLVVDGRFAMTATLDILEDMAAGRGPSKAMLALGYAGWGPGQLEQEIARNGWLTADAEPDLVFSTEMDKKWEAAMQSIGIHPLMLSPTAGHA